MDISNNTGQDANYRIGASGPQGVKPRPLPGWQPLNKRRRIKHSLDQPGPWRVEFLVQTGAEEIHVSSIAHTAADLVELTETSGSFDVVVTRAAAG
jgi:hypothetical protein